jgi:hypothetical protein
LIILQKENIMATVDVKVVKTYRVTFEVKRPVDHDAVMKKAQDMVYRGDSDVVYEGLRATEIINVKYTDEEADEAEKELEAFGGRYLAIDKILDKLNCKNVIVSLSEEEQEDIIFDEVFASGSEKYKFIYPSGLFNKSYSSEIYYSPLLSWKDVLIEADRVIRESGDFHHIFLESVEDRGEIDGVRVFEFYFGS